MRKKTEKVPKESEKQLEEPVVNKPKKARKSALFAILGIGIALVVVSTTYCVAVILLGTKGIAPKIMVSPAVLFNIVIVGIAFSKLFK